MKTKLAIMLLLVALTQPLFAQTADDYVNAGRAFLSVTNIVAANASFSSAVALSPNHQTANVFYAVTRLLVLPSQPVGSNFLDRIGMPAVGRDIYNWTAYLPIDTNGVPLAPAGVNANESALMLRTNVLPSLIAAEANLAKVTDTNFTLSLTSNETRIVAVTLDYGDVLMLRAMLQAAEYAAYTTYSWNLDAQLAAIRSLYTNDEFSIERVLMDYPHLLTFATTNDLNAAKLAFQNAVNRYMAASEYIRNRPTNVTRLFNYDAGMADQETNFRTALTELSQSLNGPVMLTVDTNLTVNLSRHFDGGRSLRSFLPQFAGNAIIAGSLPDATFGGLAQGLPPYEVEHYLGYDKNTGGNPVGAVAFVSRFGVPQRLPDGSIQVALNALDGAIYVIQVSDDLKVWTNLVTSEVQVGILSFWDSGVYGSPHRYYRAFDALNPAAGYHPPNDNFSQSLPLSGTNVNTRGANAGATKESGEPNHAGNTGGKSVWWTWTAATDYSVTVDTIGSSFDTTLVVYTGNSVASLSLVASDDDGGGNYTSKLTFSGVAGTTYQIAVDGYGGDSGSITLHIQEVLPPSALSTPLTLNVPVNNLSGAIDGQTNFVVTIPAGKPSLHINISGGTGDCDLYVRFGSQPTLSLWDYSLYVGGNTESVTIPNPPAGNWYIMLHGYDPYSGVTLLAQ